MGIPEFEGWPFAGGVFLRSDLTSVPRIVPELGGPVRSDDVTLGCRATIRLMDAGPVTNEHDVLVSDVAWDRVTTQFGELAMARASRRDAVVVLRLRDALGVWMVASGIDQWRPGDMPLAWLEECAEQGWIFVARRDGKLVGSVTLVWTDPFIWGDRNEPAGYIHMLMVDREHAHLGLGRSLLDWAERQITRSGHRRARLDCVRTNLGLRAYYEDAGYLLVEDREFEGNIPAVVLYEKELST